MRRWLRSTGEETFADYQRRVVADLFTLADQFRAQGIPVHAIAVPFGDYGQQDAGNDPRVVPFTFGLLETQFGTVFVQNDRATTRPSAANRRRSAGALGGAPVKRPRGHLYPGCAPMTRRVRGCHTGFGRQGRNPPRSTDSRSPRQTQP